MQTAEIYMQKGFSEIPIEIDDLQFKGTRVRELMVGYAKLCAKECIGLLNPECSELMIKEMKSLIKKIK